MTRIGYDGVDPTRLPRDAAVVLGYDDGLYRWPQQGWGLFPHSLQVHIDVFPSTNSGKVLDIEKSDATPAQSVDWVLNRRKAGVDPTAYMDMETWPQVRAAFQARKVQEPHYWVAQWDGVRQVPLGAIGKQFYNNDSAGYDMSVFADYWPGVDAPPQPGPGQNFPKWPGYIFKYDPTKTLRYDHNVQVWQQRMRDRGWIIQADGFYGEKSAGVCLKFQQDSSAHGWPLQEDSIVGEHTWDAAWERPISKS